jgi:hypothetical protein
MRDLNVTGEFHLHTGRSGPGRYRGTFRTSAEALRAARESRHVEIWRGGSLVYMSHPTMGQHTYA